MNKKSLKSQDPEFLSTLERGLSVLRAFDQEHPEMKLSEVAEITGLNPAVARRCLNTLVKLGYVGCHGRNFLLRPEVLTFGAAFLASMNLEQVATPYLRALRDETGDSSSLAVLSGLEILYLVHVSSNRQIRLSASLGTRFPIYATSLGRVLLAYQPEEVIEEYLLNANLEKLTEYTITSKQDLRATLRQIRVLGYDSAQDELDYGIVSVSVPVFDSQRQIATAINCSTSTTRVSRDDLIQTRLPLLQRAAGEIESAFHRWPFLVHSIKGSR